VLDRRDLERMARTARKNEAVRSPVVGIVARDCLCVACKYNLKGMKFDGKCPECGTAVARSIDMLDPDAKPWEDPMAWRPGWWISLFGPPTPREPPEKKAPPVAAPRRADAPQPCPRCGYDCKGLPPIRPCPECGTPRAASMRASAVDAHEAIHALASRAADGMLLRLGWGVAGLALFLQWVVFAAAVSFGGAPWALTGQVLYAAAAAGSSLAAIGSLRLLVLAPPIEVARQTMVGTRFIGVTGCGLWGLTCAVVAFGMWRGWDSGVLYLVHLGFLPASVLLAFYCRTMYVVAAMVGRSEQSVQTATVGFPMTVLALLVICAWFVFIGPIPLISFITVLFTSFFCGVFTLRFFYGNANVGAGIWWARRNLDEAVDRYRRKVERWEARARADREKERVHGSSARL